MFNIIKNRKIIHIIAIVNIFISTLFQLTSHFIALTINFFISVMKRHKNNQVNQHVGISAAKNNHSRPFQ